MSRPGARVGDPKKVNGDLFSLTYGALVTQILRDTENVNETGKQLKRMGHNIGVRLVEDYLARTGTGRCSDFRDTADKIQIAFRLYLSVNPVITGWNPASTEFSLVLDSNPLADFVELPDKCQQLQFSNILPGVIKGACEMVQLEVDSWFVQDQLKGDPVTELRIQFIRKMEDAVPAGED